MSNAINVTMFGVGADGKTLYSELEELGHYPEHRLWCAVLIATIDEYQEHCLRISTAWSLYQYPVNHALFTGLNHIRTECKNRWFQTICDMADCPMPKIFTKFDELDREYGIAHIPQDKTGPIYLSDYQIRGRIKPRRNSH